MFFHSSAFLFECKKPQHLYELYGRTGGILASLFLVTGSGEQLSQDGSC